MRVFVVRHGIAVDAAEHDGDDASRPLTARGRGRVRDAAAGLDALGVEPALLLSSRLVRARETAAIIGKALGLPVRETAALAPGARPERLLDELRRHGAEAALVVGHRPHLDRFIALAVGADEPFTEVGKAGVAALDFTAPDRPARLLWLLEPRQLRRLG